MNELIPLNKEQEYELMKKQAAAFYQSGMFTDIKSHSQALVKVMAGQEMGIPPFASMTGIHMIDGKPVPGANLIATRIANHPAYNYRVLICTKETCEIDFFESKDNAINQETWVGKSSFTIQEAQEAGLLGKNNWKKYPSDMLFARAISRGAKRYAPGIFGGTVFYTPDELGADFDEDGVVLREPIEVHAKPVPGSDEAIIEEIKETHVISEEFR